MRGHEFRVWDSTKDLQVIVKKVEGDDEVVSYPALNFLVGEMYKDVKAGEKHEAPKSSRSSSSKDVSDESTGGDDDDSRGDDDSMEGQVDEDSKLLDRIEALKVKKQDKCSLFLAIDAW